MLKVYLSGEIHTDWREQIIEGAKALDVSFTAPVTDHARIDDCGVAILGEETTNLARSQRCQINAIRTRKGIRTQMSSLCVLVRNTNSGTQPLMQAMPLRLGKSLIILHPGDDHQHALKEVDAAALAVAKSPSKLLRFFVMF